MKILHVSALPVWSMDGKGGMPSLVETLKGHLTGGHNICLVLPKYDPFSEDSTRLSVPEDKQLEVVFAPCKWLFLFKKVRSSTYKFFNTKSLPFFVRWVLNMLMYFGLTFSLTFQGIKVLKRGYAANLVYAHNQYAALSGFLLSRYKKIPNVTRLYGTFLADLMKKPLVSLRYPTASAGYLVPSDLLICANDGTRGDEVARKFGISSQRFRFWQNGVEPPARPPSANRSDLKKRFPKLQIDSKWLVSCSRLSYWKRIDRMLNALKVCKEESVDCLLVIAGDGPEKENLQQMAFDLDVMDRVVWLGAVAHDDIWSLMNNADAFLITNDVTNRCNPLYEAAWAGLPVVSIKDPSTSDLLEHDKNSLLSERDNHKELGLNILNICKDKELRNRLSVAQKKLSETFWTWEERMSVEVSELENLVKVFFEKKGGSSHVN